ncbi:putative ABC transport system permease protein [Cognatiyoonia koreensis]|uniref:Putative ABC transport system permease protein n=1 Tax=Cognatiyoonia koreensis TaxID=364200 RepID=A0A1I0QHI9_9RHOB|nr:ABC transporter permease [Cognatiyoonia koreensis]SEW26462.1 putative ABC transport system permease protein [Cognatiyoonia koreensis]
MQAIDQKLLRDFRRLWVQAIAIALVLACGVAILLTSIGMYSALSETRAAYYERNRFAHVFASAIRAPLSLVPEIADIDGVLSVSARVTGEAILDIPGRSETAVGKILSYPDGGDPLLNVPLLIAGRFPDPTRPNEIVVNAPFAEANGFHPGDGFSANLRGQKRDLTIVGTALSPEFIYTIGPGAMMPDNESFGIIWMSERAAAAAFDMDGAFNDLAVAIASGVQTASIIDDIDDLLEPYGGLGANDRSTHPSNAFLDAEIAQLRGMAAILPPIFFAISGFLVSMVMGRIVALERSEIGLLKAIGYSNTGVCLHYLMLAGLIAVAGVLLGWAAGTYLARALAGQYAQFFNFPFVIFRVPFWVYAVAALAGIMTTSLGAAQAALKAARLAPAIAMQPPAPPRFKRSLADRAMEAMRLSQPTIMILRSLLRWPFRSFLTGLGLSLAVASVIASFFMNDALDEIVDLAFYQTNRQDAMLLFDTEVPETVITEISRLPGVLQVESQQFSPVILRHGHLTKRVALEARQPGSDLSRVLDAAGAQVNPPPGGIYLSERLAGALDLQSGDIVEAEFLSGQRETHDLVVTGLVEVHFGLGAYVDLGYLNRLLRQSDRISVANITLDSHSKDALHEAIKELPRVSGIVEMDENRRSFQETIETNVVVMNTIYIGIAVLITIGVTYNAARIQLSERARELASLRILGFGRGEVSYILVGEMMLIGVLAQPLGWFIGAWIAQAMTNSFSSDLYTIPLVLNPATFTTGSLVVLIAAFFSVMIVRRRLNNLDLVAVMKTRE